MVSCRFHWVCSLEIGDGDPGAPSVGGIQMIENVTRHLRPWGGCGERLGFPRGALPWYGQVDGRSIGCGAEPWLHLPTDRSPAMLWVSGLSSSQRGR